MCELISKVLSYVFNFFTYTTHLPVPLHTAYQEYTRRPCRPHPQACLTQSGCGFVSLYLRQASYAFPLSQAGSTSFIPDFEYGSDWTLVGLKVARYWLPSRLDICIKQSCIYINYHQPCC